MIYSACLLKACARVNVWGAAVVRSKGIENRKFPRFTISLEVEVRDAASGLQIFNTKDISDGGVFLAMDINNAPPIGAELELKLKEIGGGEEPQPVKVRVVRVTEDGIGLEFIESP